MPLNTIDLRHEFIDILDGDEFNDPISIPMIYREIDLSDKCVCNSPSGEGGGVDADCKYCDNERYMWTEHAVKVYLSKSTVMISKGGDIRSENVFLPIMAEDQESGIIFLRCNGLAPSIGDSFFQIRLKKDGNVYYLVDSDGKRYYERLNKYIVLSSDRIYGDNGELLYYRMIVKADLTWLKNRPGHRRY